MNIRLNHKTDYYELFINNHQIEFFFRRNFKYKYKEKLQFKLHILLNAASFWIRLVSLYMYVCMSSN